MWNIPYVFYPRFFISRQINTIYKNIKRLLPGTSAKISFGNKLVVNFEEYFDLTKNKIDYEIIESNPRKINKKSYADNFTK